MYKVLKEVIQDSTTGSCASSELSLGGRVRSEGAKQILSKQLGKALEGMGSNQLDLKTGRINSRKPKKEKSAEQLAIAEAKQLHSKFLGFDGFLGIQIDLCRTYLLRLGSGPSNLDSLNQNPSNFTPAVTILG